MTSVGLTEPPLWWNIAWTFFLIEMPASSLISSCFLTDNGIFWWARIKRTWSGKTPWLCASQNVVIIHWPFFSRSLARILAEQPAVKRGSLGKRGTYLIRTILQYNYCTFICYLSNILLYLYKVSIQQKNVGSKLLQCAQLLIWKGTKHLVSHFEVIHVIHNRNNLYIECHVDYDKAGHPSSAWDANPCSTYTSQQFAQSLLSYSYGEQCQNQLARAEAR